MIQPTDADRWGEVDPEPPPADLVEPEDRMLLEHVSGGRVPRRPIRRRLTDLPALVRHRGGEYFFVAACAPYAG